MEELLQKISKTIFSFFIDHHLTITVGLAVLVIIVTVLMNLLDKGDPWKVNYIMKSAILFIVILLFINGCTATLLSQ
ncbi:hypothetical protein [Tetragenococcus halophilus]|uniref:Uncharacterized protein n=1 Tax=Tetragenococcus halophilus TaxID=51669 RepID=A0AB35HRC4_TETHA|nr:hypothetical protein [Tetragenococcus halophilus]MCO8296226.1 hypothetical protein [Tetragenococcus halophilus]MCO8298791.1 hypothetical protein [Tetragenococcus halophilus]